MQAQQPLKMKLEENEKTEICEDTLESGIADHVWKEKEHTSF